MNTLDAAKLYAELTAAIDAAKLALAKDAPKKLKYQLKYSSIHHGTIIPKGMTGKTLEKYLPKQALTHNVVVRSHFTQTLRSDKEILLQNKIEPPKNGFIKIIHR